MATNALTNEILTLMEPRVALIVYEHKGEYGDQKHYTELRHIDQKGQMGVGMPVTYELMREISESFAGVNSTTPWGEIPSNMIYSDTRKGYEKYIWYNLPRKRLMFFSENLNIPDGEYYVPGVIYEATQSSLKIYAFTDDKPGPDTKLYNGPFFNTTGGNVCLGSSNIRKPESPSYQKFIKFWEDRFWMTKFSHLGSNGSPTKSNLVAVTMEAADKPFDHNELCSAGKKLKELWK